MPLYRVFTRSPFYESTENPKYLCVDTGLELWAPGAPEAITEAKQRGIPAPSVELVCEDLE